MLFWAVDNPAPANYLLISGDRDFANALHQLRMRRYNILLAQPFKASAALVAAAKSVWLWTTLLQGGPPLQHSTPPLVLVVDSNSNSDITANQVSLSQPSHTNPINTDPNQKFNSPARTDPKHRGKYVRKTPNQPQPQPQPNLHLQKAMPSGVPESGSSSTGYTDPSASGMDRRDYPSNQQTQYVHNISTQPFLQKAPSMPSGVTDSWSVSNSFSANSDPSARIRSDFTGNQQTQYSYRSRPTTLPVHSNSAPGNLYPPNVHTHPFRPVSRPEAPPFSSPFTNAPEITKLCISERPPFVQNSVNLQQAARAEVKINSRKHSNSTSRNVSQKGPNMHTSYNYNSSNGRSSEPGCNMTSLPTASVPSGVCVQQGAVTIPPPSEYEQGLVGVILLALDNLRNEKMTPTEANITDCIRFGDLKHRNTDVRKALDCAVKQNMVEKKILGQVQMYVIKNQQLWNCVNPMGGNANQYPKATWDRIQEFLISSDGRSAITASTCRYEAGLVLKNSCLQDFALGQVLQILSMLVTVKKWMKHHPSGWKPVTITLVEVDTETSKSADSDA